MKKEFTTWKSNATINFSDYIELIGTFNKEDMKQVKIEYKESISTWNSKERIFLSDYKYLLNSEIVTRDYTPVYPYSFEYLALNESEFLKVYTSDKLHYRYAYEIRQEKERQEKERQYKAFMDSIDYSDNSISRKGMTVKQLTDGHINNRIADMRHYLDTRKQYLESLEISEPWESDVIINLSEYSIYVIPTVHYPNINEFMEYPTKWTNNIVCYPFNDEYIIDSHTNLSFDTDRHNKPVYTDNADTFSAQYLELSNTIDWESINKTVRQYIPWLIPVSIHNVKDLLSWFIENHSTNLFKGIVKYIATRKGKEGKEGLKFSHATIVSEEIVKHGYYDYVSNDCEYYETYLHMLDNFTDTLVDMFRYDHENNFSWFKECFNVKTLDVHGNSRILEFKSFDVTKKDKEGNITIVTRSYWWLLVRAVENAINQMKRFNSSSRIMALMKQEEKEITAIDALLDSYSSSCYQSLDEKYADNEIYTDFWQYVKRMYPKKYVPLKDIQRMKSDGYDNKEIALQFGKSTRYIERMNTLLKDIIVEYSEVCNYMNYDNVDIHNKRIRNVSK